LAAKPKVVLADELSLGLAPIVVSRILSGVRMAANDGTGVLLVEQQVRTALEVCDRAYVMRRGKVVMSGTSDDLGGMMSEIEGHYLDTSTT